MNGGGEGGGGGNGFAEWRGAVSPAARYAESGGASLTWENLTAVLPGSGGRSTKKLVQGLYGYAVPGRVVAIMGPSGSGKSTLLDSLSGEFFTSFFLLVYRVELRSPLKAKLRTPPRVLQPRSSTATVSFISSTDFSFIFFQIVTHTYTVMEDEAPIYDRGRMTVV
jgi:hypothetical protein